MQHKMDNENLRNNEPTAMPSESVTMTHNNMRNENTSGGEENLPGCFSDENGNLKFANVVVKCPCCCCCSVLWFCILMTLLLGASFRGAELTDIVTDGQHNYDVFDIRSKAYDSLRLARKEVVDNRKTGAQKSTVELQQSEMNNIIYWIYEATTPEGMFSSKAILDMFEAESIMTLHADWPSYCQKEYPRHKNGTFITTNPDDAQCAFPLSALRIFYPESYDAALVAQAILLLSDENNVQNYNKVAPCIDFGVQCDMLLPQVSIGALEIVYELKKDLDAIISKWNGKGKMPIEDPKQLANFCAHLKLLPTRAGLVDFFFDQNFNVSNPVSMYSRSITYFGGPRKGYKNTTDREGEQDAEVKKYVLDNLYEDMQRVSKKSNSKETNTFYFMTAIIFDIFIKILIQDMSAAILSVLLVFWYLWYMLGSLFLAAVGMAEILLSIPCAWFIFRLIFRIKYFGGLNMLSIFIVCAIGADDIFVFMDAYKQSAYKGPAVNANIATRLSWVWRKSGLAMAITSATTCAAFLCTCFSPMAETRSFGIFAALVILWDYLLVMSLFCSAVIVYHDYFERDPLCSVPLCCGCCVQDCNCSKQSPSPTEKILSSFHDNRVIPQDRVTSFFSGPVTKFICGIKQRILVFICFLAWIIPAVVYVTKLEPTKTAEQFLRSDHPLQYSITILQSEFPTSSEDRGLPIFFAWGINVLDQGGVNQLMDPNFVGRVNLDSGFKYTEECQRKIMDACDDLKYDRSPKRLELMKRAEDGFSEIRCAAWDFAEFAVKNGYTKNVSDPVPYEKVNEALKAYVESPQSNADMAVNMGYDGTRLLFTAIEVESQTLDQWSSMPEDVVLVHYNDFMMLAKELEDKVGDACGTRRVLMTDLEQKWIFMNNQKVYRTSALTGAIIGVAIAFVVLLLATWSALLSILSVISILCTIVSVIGTVTMLGWTLGTIEAILISILAGFSVDYVVHLAHAYAGSSGQNHERVQHAFGEMGTPVLSGMLTSVLASLPLFSCQIVFFAKFGTFLCFTILWSWVFANFGFMSVVATIGSSKNVEKSATVETAGNVGKEMTENVAPKRTEEEPWT